MSLLQRIVSAFPQRKHRSQAAVQPYVDDAPPVRPKVNILVTAEGGVPLAHKESYNVYRQDQPACSPRLSNISGSTITGGDVSGVLSEDARTWTTSFRPSQISSQLSAPASSTRTSKREPAATEPDSLDVHSRKWGSSCSSGTRLSTHNWCEMLPGAVRHESASSRMPASRASESRHRASSWSSWTSSLDYSLTGSQGHSARNSIEVSEEAEELSNQLGCAMQELGELRASLEAQRFVSGMTARVALQQAEAALQEAEEARQEAEVARAASEARAQRAESGKEQAEVQVKAERRRAAQRLHEANLKCRILESQLDNADHAEHLGWRPPRPARTNSKDSLMEVRQDSYATPIRANAQGLFDGAWELDREASLCRQGGGELPASWLHFLTIDGASLVDGDGESTTLEMNDTGQTVLQGGVLSLVGGNLIRMGKSGRSQRFVRVTREA